MKKKNSWFRMYAEVVDDPKVQRLSGDLFKCWVNLLCMACKYNGKISVEDFAFGLRINNKRAQEVLNSFISAELIEIIEDIIIPHNWDGRQFLSDNSTERSQRCRDRKKRMFENDTATVDATPLQRCMQQPINDTATVDATPLQRCMQQPINDTATVDATPPDTDTDTEKEPPISPTEENPVTTPKREKPPGQQYAPEFERFWAAFPRKVSKGSAYKAWKKEKPPLDACLKALNWQKKTLEWTKDQGQFIPYPATWVNARGWENEPWQPTNTQRRTSNLAY